MMNAQEPKWIDEEEELDVEFLNQISEGEGERQAQGDLNEERYRRIASIAGTDWWFVRDFVEGEFDNQAEHDAWIKTTTDQEIADWVAGCLA